MPDLTVITPIAPRHAALFADCAASVARQTVEVKHLYMIDQAGFGPARLRNWMIQQVETPYLTFLDADDWLEPTFAEATLKAVRPARYIYTDWYKGEDEVVEAPECAWVRGTHHLVTAVLPTAWAQAVGGFDEALIGMEDTDFYVKLVTRGFCGKRLPLPLVHYRRHGGRADRIHRTGEIEALNAEMARRYGGKSVSCCGESPVIPAVPAGERAEGDVIARALWGGNRTVHGMATGREYPRSGNGKLVYVDPRDIAASPHLWQAVPEVPELPQVEQDSPKAVAPEPPSELRGLAALEAQLVGIGMVRVPRKGGGSPVTRRTVEAGGIVAHLPNMRKVVRLAKRGYGEVDAAVFVMPRKLYPSYTDFWRLVELAGFETVYQDEVDLSDRRQTYIFAAPESIPDCSNALARTIFWALEYVGDYVAVKNAQTVREIWSSDPAHARRAGSRYVLLGSHRGLKPDLDAPRGDLYDLTMLAYMVNRREAVKNHLINYRWPENYPGHSGARRHAVLSNTRLMVHVHQHEDAALTPLRLALAAAYRMTVISESVPDAGMYRSAVIWADYQDIVSRARLNLDGKDGIGESGSYGDKLYSLLCVEHPFEKCVLQALEGGAALGIADSAKAA